MSKKLLFIVLLLGSALGIVPIVSAGEETGSELLYLSRGSLYVMDMANNTKLYDTKSYGFVTKALWSQDGNEILFTTGCALHRMNVDGSDIHDFLDHEQLCVYDFILSPDGTYIAIIQNDGPRLNYSLFIADNSGKYVTTVSDNVPECCVIWTSDNTLWFTVDSVTQNKGGVVTMQPNGLGSISEATSVPFVPDQVPHLRLPYWANHMLIQDGEYDPDKQFYASILKGPADVAGQPVEKEFMFVSDLGEGGGFKEIEFATQPQWRRGPKSGWTKMKWD